MFARDYKIEITADTNDRVFWKLIRKGEHVSPSDEEKELVTGMLGEVYNKIYKSLDEYRQRKRDESLPVIHILRQVPVIDDNLSEFQGLLQEGIIERMTYSPAGCPTIRLWLVGSKTYADTGDWLILDTEHRWWVMKGAYHQRMKKMGKIIIDNVTQKRV